MDRNDQIKKWRQNIPPTYNGVFRKQYDKAINRQSMRAAINTKCLDGTGWERAEVKRCDIVTCPLHPYRPYQTNPNTSIGSEDNTI